MGALRALADRLLTVGALCGAVVLVVVLGGLVSGVRPVFLRSGSMAPTMPTGTLALVREVPADQLSVGDVVCVEASPGVRVTHRIAAIERVDGVALLTLRGDANASPDPRTYAVHRADRVVADVPAAGYLFGWMRTPAGYAVLGAAGFGLLLLLGGGRRPPSDRDGRSPGRGRSGKRRAGVAVGEVAALTVLATLGPGQVPTASAAPWTDPATISGTTLTAGTVAAPATFTCGALGVLSVRFNWTAVVGATDYTLHYGSGGASTVTVTGTTVLLTAAITGGTAWLVANRDFGATTWSSVPSVSRSYTVAVVSLCA